MHVDYSDDMMAALTDAFLDDNNVRFVLQVQVQTSKLLLLDRFSPSAHNWTEFDQMKQLLSEVKAAVKSHSKQIQKRILSSASNNGTAELNHYQTSQ